MSGKAFFDTNIFIYLYADNERDKQTKSMEIVNKADECITSTQVLNKAVSSFSQQDVAVLESKLRLSQSAGLRRLGLALLIEITDQHGWSCERRNHLNEYCKDTDLWISEAAGLTEPPKSLEENSNNLKE